VIIAGQVSPLRPRFLATALPLAVAVLTAASAPVLAAPADTWHLLTQQPQGVGGEPVLALAADPNTPARVIYGTATGDVYRSSDGGATFSRVASGLGKGVSVLAFDPIEPTHVLAGTKGAGIWRSDDSGGTWQALDHGTETVRSFAFSLGLSSAGTDSGVLVTTDGDTWTSAGLRDASIAAVAAGGGQLYAGADVDHAAQGLALFHSADGGKSWKQVAAPSSSGQIVASLALTTKALLLGTESGLFASADGGTTWSSLSSSGALPSTDYTAIALSGSRVYVASDGGAGSTGGLWATDDGQTFRSLAAPLPSVTALDVVGTTVYAATYRPIDHAVELWSYSDDGGTPQSPDATLTSPAPVAGAPTPSPARLSSEWLTALIKGPEAPFLALGAGAVLILLLALIAYMRRGRA
jgi:photosystem II stability/assembly factor-like uncharacterized protein